MENGWLEHKNLVLHELTRLNETNKGIGKTLVDIQKDIARLQVKSTVWGSVGGALTVVIFLLIKTLG